MRIVQTSAAFLFGTALLAEPQAPPPAITQVDRTVPEAEVTAGQIVRAGAGTTAYSIGEPTDEEQLYLELLNRTRADALTEALRLANTTDPEILNAYQFFNVDLQKFVNDTAPYPAVQPLAFEPRMIQAARGHSQWMLNAGIQAHIETNPTNDPGDRLTAAGYPWSTYGESIYAYAQSVTHGHAGFEVDWGNGPGGMQDPPGHRINNHNAAFREIGIGVINGTGANGTGPQSVTFNFGNRANLGPLLTGVAYYDLNGNQFYDLGEGVGGFTVNVNDATFHAVTSTSGGYAVPSANGARTVTFSGAGLTPTTVNRTVSGNLNAKADLRLTYSAPALAGSATPAVGVPNTYSFPAVPGATGYQWQVAQATAWAGVEGAEQGLANVVTQITGSYSPVTLLTRRTGTAGFQLAHPAVSPVNQFLTLNARLRVNAGGRLLFWKRIGFASTAQVAVAQVSDNDGASWTTVWNQAGNGATSSLDIELTFTQQSIDLSAFAGKTVRVRFGYLFQSGSFFPDASSLTGFFFDDISFTGTDVLTGVVTTPVAAGTSFNFQPAVAGSYLLSVQPKIGSRSLPPGPSLAVAATVQPVLVVGAVVIKRGPMGKVRLDFPITGGTPTSVILEQATAINGPYVATSEIVSEVGAGLYAFKSLEPVGNTFFWRIRAQ